MKTVLHTPQGQTYIAERPTPQFGPRQILVETAFVWISPGTECGYLRRMRENATDDPEHRPMGYMGSGVVLEAGAEATEFSPGQKVGLYGSPYVHMTQHIAVGRNLAVPIPDDMSLAEAASVGFGVIAMHGLRRIDLTLGDVVILVGLGPLGMISAQLANAWGADVIALDLLQQRVDIANEILPGRAFKADTVDLKKLVMSRTRGRGADALVQCTSGANSSTAPLVELLRRRGRVSLTGGARSDFTGGRKEIEIKSVHAGGPGRRDPLYEVEGVDYPVEYVRWTENRNMEAYLRLLGEGKINVKPMVSHCCSIDDAPAILDKIVENPEKTLGVVVDISGKYHGLEARGDLA
ncbi:MAG: zinc-binding alcohol dehydrogenase [Planctomycetes bacterium]|nr:zinc-binding alcohol dehydrogenase [Planctomycetota bacterium]